MGKQQMSQSLNNESLKTLLLVASSFTFAYCFGVTIHEIGHVLAYQYYDIDTIIFVLDPFGHSYMEPIKDYAPGELLQRSGGSLFNVICACLVSSIFWKKHNLYAFPLLMWSGAAFIQESVAILLDTMNGLPRDWAFVAAEGVSVYLVLALSALFMFIGCAIFLRLLAIAGVRTHHSNAKIMTISLMGISPFFVISLIYVAIFFTAEDRGWILSKSIALGASVLLSLLFSLLFKPLYPVLDKVLSIKTQTIKFEHVSSSIGIALVFITFCTFFYN